MEAITRTEKLLSGQQLEPITRKEMFLAKMAGMDVKTPTPYTREEMFMQNVIDNGGGGGNNGGGGLDTTATEILSGATVIRNSDANLIGDNVFYSSNVTSVYLPKVQQIGKRAFYESVLLESVYIPNCKYIFDYAFAGCTELTNIDISDVVTLGIQALSGVPVRSIRLNKIRSIPTGTFSECIELRKVDIVAAEHIGNRAFFGCSLLETVIIRTLSKVCSIHLGAFENTPLVTGNPKQAYFYIPSSMYEDYRAEYSMALDSAFGYDGMFDYLFRKIEDYPEICG